MGIPKDLPWLCPRVLSRICMADLWSGVSAKEAVGLRCVALGGSLRTSEPMSESGRVASMVSRFLFFRQKQCGWEAEFHRSSLPASDEGFGGGRVPGLGTQAAAPFFPGPKGEVGLEPEKCNRRKGMSLCRGPFPGQQPSGLLPAPAGATPALPCCPRDSEASPGPTQQRTPTP